MTKTVVFVTNQFSSDRLIHAAEIVAKKLRTQLNIVEIMDSEYDLDPEAVDYLFMLAQKTGATMRLMSAEDKFGTMCGIIEEPDVRCVVTGMPQSHQSILYDIWKKFPRKAFHVLDSSGEIVEVAHNKFATA